MKQVTIVCDGSSLGNGKGNSRAAAVAVLGFKGIWKAFGEYLGNATNQQAEIAAAWIGLKNLKEPCRVKVLSDSRYVVETMSGLSVKKPISIGGPNSTRRQRSTISTGSGSKATPDMKCRKSPTRPPGR